MRGVVKAESLRRTTATETHAQCREIREGGIAARVQAPNLAGIVVEKVIQLSEARDECRAWRELLQQALELLAKRNHELKAARATIEFQRLEIRALTAGRTIAEQRQQESKGRAA